MSQAIRESSTHHRRKIDYLSCEVHRSGEFQHPIDGTAEKAEVVEIPSSSSRYLGGEGILCAKSVDESVVTCRAGQSRHGSCYRKAQIIQSDSHAYRRYVQVHWYKEKSISHPISTTPRHECVHLMALSTRLYASNNVHAFPGI